MSGFLAAAIEARAVEANDGVVEAVFDAWKADATASLIVEALAVRTAGLLDDAGVRWRLTKGAAIAHLDYRAQLSQRCFGDMDVVIHPHDWDRALAALRQSGHRRPSPELRPGFDRRFGKGATIIDPNNLEIDLHLRFAIGRFAVGARMEELFIRGDHVELAGRRIPTLAGPDRLLHACHHAVLGGLSDFRVARDVAQLLLVSNVAWEETRDTAERWRAGAVVAMAILRSWAKLQLDVAHPAHAWACGYVIARRDARAIDVFLRARPFREQALTAVGALPRRLVPAYLFALGLPSRPAREARGRTRTSHLRSRTRLIIRPSDRQSSLLPSAAPASSRRPVTWSCDEPDEAG